MPHAATSLLATVLAVSSPETEPPAVQSIPHKHQPLLGELFEGRPWLEAHGLTVDIVYVADWSKNLRGGVSTNGSNVGRLFDVILTLDTAAAGLWPDGTFLVDFICQGGHFASADVGDLQVVDNLDADGRVAIYELWYEHAFSDGAARLKIGKIDANIDFDVPAFTADFIHSSPGASPTVLGFPAYPDPATGAQLFLRPAEWVYLGLGVFDGATQEGFNTGLRGPSTFFGSPADLFLITEAGVRWNAFTDGHPGRAAIGLWRHTGTFDRFDGGTNHGTCGIYGLADQLLWKSANRQLGVFLQYGWADPEVSAIEHHLGAGIALAGPLEVRPNDSIGLMISTALLTSESAAGFQDDFESAIELYYKCQLTPWLSMQPDLQYVINPGGVSENDDAIVFILRVTADF